MFDESLFAQMKPDSEFYARLEREEDAADVEPPQQQPPGSDDSLSALEGRIVKRHFRPVLRQLKDRIEPINTAMRDRERRFWLDKGLDVATPVDEDCGRTSSRGESSDDDLVDEFGRMRRPRRSGGPGKHHSNGLADADSYEETRRFLAAKHPINLLSMSGDAGTTMALPLPRRVMEEDILE